MQAMLAWGNRHFAPKGPSVVITNRETGEAADPVLIDRVSGRPLSDPVFRIAPDPAANERVLRKLAGADRAMQSEAPTPASASKRGSTAPPAKAPARSAPAAHT
jgi:hypothetical protein